MGVGMLSMPYAMRLGGWAGLGALAGSLALFNVSAHALVAGLGRLPPGAPPTYPALGAAAFGDRGKGIVTLLAVAEFGGGAVLTLAFAFSQAHLFFPASAPLSRVAPWVLAAIAPLLAVPSFSKLTSLSALGNIASVAVFGGVALCALADPSRAHAAHAHATTPPPHHAIGWGVLRAAGIFSVAVSGHSSLPALRASMARPEKFHAVINAAFACMALLYGGVCTVGYAYWGDGARQVVTASIARESPFAGRALLPAFPALTLDAVVGGCVLLNAVTTYPALIMVVQANVLAAAAGPAAPRVRAAPRLAARAAIAAATAVVAVAAYASLANALALLGGMASMSCSLLLPAACFLSLSAGRPGTGPPAGARTRGALWALLAVGVVVTAGVVAQAVGDLVGASNGPALGRWGAPGWPRRGGW
jgi:vesicular inhibitory amino acid transporter